MRSAKLASFGGYIVVTSRSYKNGLHVCCCRNAQRVNTATPSLRTAPAPFAARRLAGSAAGAGAACASRAARAARHARGPRARSNEARGCRHGGSSQAARVEAAMRGRARCIHRRAGPRQEAWVLKCGGYQRRWVDTRVQAIEQPRVGIQAATALLRWHPSGDGAPHGLTDGSLRAS